MQPTNTFNIVCKHRLSFDSQTQVHKVLSKAYIFKSLVVSNRSSYSVCITTDTGSFLQTILPTGKPSIDHHQWGKLTQEMWVKLTQEFTHALK